MHTMKVNSKSTLVKWIRDWKLSDVPAIVIFIEFCSNFICLGLLGINHVSKSPILHPHMATWYSLCNKSVYSYYLQPYTFRKCLLLLSLNYLTKFTVVISSLILCPGALQHILYLHARPQFFENKMYFGQAYFRQ